MKERYVDLPTTWDELTEKDWQELLKIRHLVATTDHQWTVEDVRTESARMLLENRGVKTNTGNVRWVELCGKVADTLTWLWEVQGQLMSLSFRTVKQLMPKVNVGTKTELLGPQPLGADMTFGEFRMALVLLRNYENPQGDTQEEREEERDAALCSLAGSLYRPAATPKQQHEQQLLRQPYDWGTLEDALRRGRSMQPWQRWGAYAWMAYFCEYLATGYFIVDDETVTFAPLFQRKEENGKRKENTADGQGVGLLRLSLIVAESGVFGTWKDVDHTPLLTVMLKLLMDLERRVTGTGT